MLMSVFVLLSLFMLRISVIMFIGCIVFTVFIVLLNVIMCVWCIRYIGVQVIVYGDSAYYV